MPKTKSIKKLNNEWEKHFNDLKTAIEKLELEAEVRGAKKERRSILAAYRGATGIQDDIFTRALEMED